MLSAYAVQFHSTLATFLRYVSYPSHTVQIQSALALKAQLETRGTYHHVLNQYI